MAHTTLLKFSCNGSNIDFKTLCNFPGFTDLAGLTLDDHITLTVIEKYLDFKVS